MANERAKEPEAKTTRREPIARRADFGGAVDAFFERQPPELRAVLDELRALIAQVAPDATASLKWGMPWFSVEGEMMCSLTAHKAHVNLVLVGPPDAFPDPDGLLRGEGKGGRHLQIRPGAELPRVAILAWLETAAGNARSKATR